MKNLTEEFKNYRLIHNFRHEEPLKAWINEDNFKDIYKEDWNALMDVVEKIENDVDGLQNIYFVEIFKSPSNNIQVCRIYNKSSKLYANCYGLNKLEATYKAVVEFIKWYNNQNK